MVLNYPWIVKRTVLIMPGGKERSKYKKKRKGFRGTARSNSPVQESDLMPSASGPSLPTPMAENINDNVEGEPELQDRSTASTRKLEAHLQHVPINSKRQRLEEKMQPKTSSQSSFKFSVVLL